MIISYALRLVFLCFASFFLTHALLGLLALAFAPAAVRRAEHMRPRRATRLLLTLRLAPAALAVLAVLGFCIPSYLWLEAPSTGERVGLVFIVAGILGAAAWALSSVRALRALFSSWRLNRSFDRAGRMQHLPSAASNALIVNGDTPILALAGVWHPRLVISRRVLGALSHQQLGAAMRHEQSHRISRDNLKRLAFLLSPSVWPFGPRAKTLERAWARLSEWAADDDACAGDSRRSVALAEALVRVARLGVAARTSVLMTCLVPETGDLSARVNRLLNPQPPAPAPQTRRRLVAVTFALLGATLIVLIAEQSVTLHAVHALLERLSH